MNRNGRSEPARAVVGPREPKRRSPGRRVRGPTALGFAEPHSREWQWAWNGLAEVTGDEDRTALDRESGEVWQYMGAALRGRSWVHEFRHRCHPFDRERRLVRVPASETWEPRKRVPLAAQADS